jgi:transposase
MPNVECLNVLRKFNQTMHERVNAENELDNPTRITTPFDVREKRFERAKIEWSAAQDMLLAHKRHCRDCRSGG